MDVLLIYVAMVLVAVPVALSLCAAAKRGDEIMRRDLAALVDDIAMARFTINTTIHIIPDKEHGND